MASTSRIVCILWVWRSVYIWFSLYSSFLFDSVSFLHAFCWYRSFKSFSFAFVRLSDDSFPLALRACEHVSFSHSHLSQSRSHMYLFFVCSLYTHCTIFVICVLLLLLLLLLWRYILAFCDLFFRNAHWISACSTLGCLFVCACVWIAYIWFFSFFFSGDYARSVCIYLHIERCIKWFCFVTFSLAHSRSG